MTGGYEKEEVGAGLLFHRDALETTINIGGVTIAVELSPATDEDKKEPGCPGDRRSKRS